MQTENYFLSFFSSLFEMFTLTRHKLNYTINLSDSVFVCLYRTVLLGWMLWSPIILIELFQWLMMKECLSAQTLISKINNIKCERVLTKINLPNQNQDGKECTKWIFRVFFFCCVSDCVHNTKFDSSVWQTEFLFGMEKSLLLLASTLCRQGQYVYMTVCILHTDTRLYLLTLCLLLMLLCTHSYIHTNRLMSGANP